MSKPRSRLEQGWGELAWSQKSLEQRLNVILGAWRYAMPALLTLMSGLLMLLPFWITGPILPNLALIGVIYWSTTRPDLLPPFVAFTIGFITDLWLGGALGVQATLLYLTALLLRAQILVFLPRPFSFTWSISIGVIFFYQILAWVLVAIFAPTLPPLSGFIAQALSTCALFPCLAWAHGRAHRFFIDKKAL